MLSPINYLFTLQGYEQEVLYIIIDSVSSLLAQNSSATECLIDILKSGQSVNSALQKYDTEMVDTVLNAIVQMLEDNASLSLLTDKLNDYQERVLAATMLGWFGSRAKNAIPDLVDLASWPRNVTGAAKQAVLLIGHAESEVISALRKSVVDNNDGEFRELWDLVVRTGYSSLPNLQDIVQMASQSSSPHLREAAADAIWCLDIISKQRFASTLDLLKNDSCEHVRQAAIEAVAHSEQP